jgi:hypothetical protein
MKRLVIAVVVALSTTPAFGGATHISSVESGSPWAADRNFIAPSQ